MSIKGEIRAAFKTALEHIATTNTNSPIGTRSYLTDPTTVSDYVEGEIQVEEERRPYIGFIQAANGYKNGPQMFFECRDEMLIDVHCFARGHLDTVELIRAELENMIEDVQAAIARDIRLGGRVTFCLPVSKDDNEGKFNVVEGWARQRFRAVFHYSVRDFA